jgi:hypothetical protein
VINGVVIADVDDNWVWIPNEDDGFTVKSLFVHLQSTLLSQMFAWKTLPKGV